MEKRTARASMIFEKMGTLKSLICLSTLMWTPVFLFSPNRNVFHRPFDNSSILNQDTFTLKLRTPFFDESSKPDKLLKHFNVGFLNSEHPISSMDDLLAMNSEEIGTPVRITPEPPAQSSAVWKLDDVKTLAAPKVLPDIMLDPEKPQAEVRPKKQPASVLDESEKELGRFVVMDTPRVEVETSRKRNYKRRLPSTLRVPSLIVDGIVRTTEGPSPNNFMEELYKMKMAQSQGTPKFQQDYVVDEEPENQEDVSHHQHLLPNSPQIVHSPLHIVHSSPQVVQVPSEVMEDSQGPVEEPNSYDPATVERFVEIMRKYVASNPHLFEQYQQKTTKDSKSNRNLRKTSRTKKQSTTVHPESIEVTTNGSEITSIPVTEEATLTSTEAVPELVSEKVDIYTKTEQSLPEKLSGNELEPETKTERQVSGEIETSSVKNVDGKIRRKKKKKVVTTTEEPKEQSSEEYEYEDE